LDKTWHKKKDISIYSANINLKYYSQGGISVLKNSEDYDCYFEDTKRAGRYENNKESVEIMIKASPEIMNDLIEYDIDFDQTKECFS